MNTPAFLSAAVAALLAVGELRAEEWGTIKGRFLCGGTPPAPVELKTDKDEVCGKHKLVTEDVVVGPEKGVANVVVFVRNENVRMNPALAEAAKHSVVLDNKNCRFEPHVVAVQTGQELVIKNSDTVGHNVNVACIKNPPFNQIVPVGDAIKTAFKAEESRLVQVACNIHPWMKAMLIVRPNPYVSISKPDGSFEISGVPAEELEIVMLHEKGYIQKYTSKDGKAEEAKKGRKKLVVPPGQTVDLGDMVIDASFFAK